MKRHRILNFYIDTTRSIFGKDKSGPVFEAYKKGEQERIAQKYGPINFDQKFERWISVPKPPLSVVDEHSHLLQDIEDSYVSGSLYSALTGACCLGERVFNQIILRVKDSYKSSPEYKEVYRKESINDWNLGINTLLAWKIIGPVTERKYRQLAVLRNNSVHFQNKDQDLGPMAKDAIFLISEIISDLFGINKENKFVIWFEVPGELYLKKVSESDPFARAFYVPCAPLVGYKHTIANSPDFVLRVVDNEIYPNQEVTDEEFVKLRNEYTKKMSEGTNT